VSDRPLIGITAYEEQACWNQWDQRAALVPSSYVGAVADAGGIPVLIPVQALSLPDAHHLLSRLDGVVLSGGSDLNPERYGDKAHPATGIARDERDDVETILIEAAGLDGLPTLAICRGLQVLNVARGGTLLQHVPDRVGNATHAPISGAYGFHDVRVEPGSLLAAAVGWGHAGVPTAHHQAIDRLGEGLVATAWTEDGTIEAVEDRSVPFLLGVQWHPEAGEDMSLFEALVSVARRTSSVSG
jgi:gamma-glutamyl-gamma-aminobutyrate hydrolase PuuD